MVSFRAKSQEPVALRHVAYTFTTKHTYNYTHRKQKQNFQQIFIILRNYEREKPLLNKDHALVDEIVLIAIQATQSRNSERFYVIFKTTFLDKTKITF